MSEKAGAGPRLHAGLEKRSLERLRSLVANFPDAEIRPPVRAAARMLLEKDRQELCNGHVAVELPRRTVWLAHKRTFNPTGPGSAGIDLFTVRPQPDARPIARLVRKTVLRGDEEDERLGWIGEALFYLEIATRLVFPGTRIPQLYGCRLENNSVVMVLEYLQPAPAQDSDLQRISCSADMVGRLGAAMHRDELYLTEWIRPVSPRLPPETLIALESAVAHCIPDVTEQRRIVGAFETFIGSPDVVARAKAHGYRSLTHGDMHMRNIFAVAETRGDMAVIDWSKVCEGLIGHDAVLLLLPRYIGSAELGSMSFAAAVDLVQRDVIAGALSVDPSLDPARLRLGLEIGLLYYAALLAARNVSAWTSEDHQGPQQQRVSSMLRHAADIAETLLHKYGS